MNLAAFLIMVVLFIGVTNRQNQLIEELGELPEKYKNSFILKKHEDEFKKKIAQYSLLLIVIVAVALTILFMK
jgi:hypothetical protein